MSVWNLRQPERDPNAWDIYEGDVKVCHMPWGSKPVAERIVRGMNSEKELLYALKSIRNMAIPGMNWTDAVGRVVLALVDSTIARAEGRL